VNNPIDQFIEIAPDCPVTRSVIPQNKGDNKSIATIEYDLLIAKPYCYTLAELKFATYVKHKQIPAPELNAHDQQLRDTFFSKPYACMRASPLTKKFGWGAHYDKEGKIAIYPVESREYQRFVEDKNIKKHSAMRSKRA